MHMTGGRRRESLWLLTIDEDNDNNPTICAATIEGTALRDPFRHWVYAESTGEFFGLVRRIHETKIPWLAPLHLYVKLNKSTASHDRPIPERSRSAGSVHIIQSVFAHAIPFCGRQPLSRRIILKEMSYTVQGPMPLASPPWSARHRDSPPLGPIPEARKREGAQPTIPSNSQRPGGAHRSPASLLG
jgi:hypothetical protein